MNKRTLQLLIRSLASALLFACTLAKAAPITGTVTNKTINKPSADDAVDANEQTIMSIAEHVSREMLTHYSRIRSESKRKAVAALDNVTITSQLGNWKTNADEWKKL